LTPDGIPQRVPGDLTGRVAVITGAARGIGRAAAVALARRGAAVAGIDIAGPVSPMVDFPPATPGDLARTGEAVQQAGGRWLSITADQRDIGAVRSAAERIEREWGGADIAFANAGIQAFKPILEMDDRDWHDQIDVNLNGTANVLPVFAPLLVRRGGGRIIITSSTQGEHGTKNGASYSASKWGLIGLMKSAALETRQLRHHGQRRHSRPHRHRADPARGPVRSGDQQRRPGTDRRPQPGRGDRQETPDRQKPARSPLDRPGRRRTGGRLPGLGRRPHGKRRVVRRHYRRQRQHHGLVALRDHDHDVLGAREGAGLPRRPVGTPDATRPVSLLRNSIVDDYPSKAA
jgi:NAD(P)-dependent dehydrogenase (short-subunit alcohol dehydrogenase family)